MANQSLTVSFVTQSDVAELTVELDEEYNSLYNDGRTSEFLFQDTVYFRVYTKPLQSELVIQAFASEGTLSTPSTLHVMDDVFQEILYFTQPPEAQGGVLADNVASLSYPYYSNWTSAGLPPGSSPCGIVSVSTTDIQEAVASSIASPGAYVVEYKAQFLRFSITSNPIPSSWPTTEPYPIVIVVTAV